MTETTDPPVSESPLSRRALSRAAVLTGWVLFFGVVLAVAVGSPFVEAATRKALAPVLLALVFAAGANLGIGGLLGVDIVFDRRTGATWMAWHAIGVFIGVWLMTFAPLLREHLARMISGPPAS